MPGRGDGVSKAGQEPGLIALLARPRSMCSRPNSIGVPGTMPEVSVMAGRGVNDGGRVKPGEVSTGQGEVFTTPRPSGSYCWLRCLRLCCEPGHCPGQTRHVDDDQDLR